MSTRLKKLLNDKKISITEEQSRNIFLKVKSKDRITKRSWKILSQEIESLGYELKTRDSQDICAKILGYRNRHILTSTESEPNFPIKLWMNFEGVLKNESLHFDYLSWYSFQATKEETASLKTLTQKDIEISKDTLSQGLNSLSLSYLGKFKTLEIKANREKLKRMTSWYNSKIEWIPVAPRSGLFKLRKRQIKELQGIRDSVLEIKDKLENPAPYQNNQDLKEKIYLYEIHEELAKNLISKIGSTLD